MVVVRLLALAAFAWTSAAQVSVKLEAEMEPVTAGEPFRLVLSTEGAVPETVKFDPDPNIFIDPTPISQSSSTSIVNGAVSHRVSLQFHAEIAEPSTVTIPAATVTIGGKPYKTKPITVTAVERVEREGPTLGDGVRVTSSADKTEVYEGEAIMLTLEVWELEGVSIKGMSKIPQTIGFYTIPQEPVVTGVVATQYEGLKYHAQQSVQMLYPTRSGQLQIGKFEWDGVVRGVVDFNGMRRRVNERFLRASDAIDITVKPLPERPDGFSGSVGSFFVEGQLSSPQVDQGVPVKLAVHITGRGNPRAVSAPKFPDLDWAFVGDPMRIDNAPELAVKGGVDQRFEFAITPHEPGEQTIPRVQYVYFDPEKETYETKGIGPFSLTVFASDESDRPVLYDSEADSSAGAIDILATDILPIVTTPRNLTRGSGLPFVFWIAVVLPVIGYAGAAAYVLRRRRFENDHGFARAYRARSEAHRRLRGVLDADRPEEALHHALIQFVADTFNAPEAGMTAHDADSLLRANGCDDELCKNVQTILRKCERAVYANQSLPTEEMKALVHGAAAVVDQTGAKTRKQGTS